MRNRGSRGKGYESPRQQCPQCGRDTAVSAKTDDWFRGRHNDPDGSACLMGGRTIRQA